MGIYQILPGWEVFMAALDSQVRKKNLCFGRPGGLFNFCFQASFLALSFHSNFQLSLFSSSFLSNIKTSFIMIARETLGGNLQLFVRLHCLLAHLHNASCLLQSTPFQLNTAHYIAFWTLHIAFFLAHLHTMSCTPVSGSTMRLRTESLLLALSSLSKVFLLGLVRSSYDGGWQT